MAQTAVNWLVNHWKKLQKEGEKMTWHQIIQITELAKEIEKENCFKDFKAGQDSMEEGGKAFDQYYNQTYQNK